MRTHEKFYLIFDSPIAGDLKFSEIYGVIKEMFLYRL